MTPIDEFIPWGTLVVECPKCRRIFSEYEVYFCYNDGYDGYTEVYDPADGFTEEYFSTRCPDCGISIVTAFQNYAEGYKVRKTDPPTRHTGFSLGSPSGFSLKPSGFSLKPKGFSLFSRRKRK